MGTKLSPKDLELYNYIDQVLYYKWDPIGILDRPNTRSEYQSYLPAVFAMVKESKSAAEIARFLSEIEQERMGLAPRKERNLKVAEILRSDPSLNLVEANISGLDDDLTLRSYEARTSLNGIYIFLLSFLNSILPGVAFILHGSLEWGFARDSHIVLGIFIFVLLPFNFFIQFLLRKFSLKKYALFTLIDILYVFVVYKGFTKANVLPLFGLWNLYFIMSNGLCLLLEKKLLLKKIEKGLTKNL